MKSKILGILIALFFAAGYVTLNYPVLGTLYNQIREGKVIDSYDHAVHTMNEQKRKKYWEDAREYNERLARENPQLSDAFSQEEKKPDSAYNHILNMEESGVMSLWRFQRFLCICQFIMELLRKFWKKESGILREVRYQLEGRIPMQY